MNITKSVNKVPIRMTDERWFHIIENHDDLVSDIMAKAEINETLNEILSIVPHVIKLSEDRMLIDYDREADVLYVSFKRPQEATDSEMLDNGVLLRYREDELVGITILDASRMFAVNT